MPDTITPLLYVKNGCPWCEEVLAYFDIHNRPYQKIIVSGNPAAMAEMERLSGQTKAPTLDWDGAILADFGVDELIPFLKEMGA
jgi:glutaredoxin 3